MMKRRKRRAPERGFPAASTFKVEMNSGNQDSRAIAAGVALGGLTPPRCQKLSCASGGARADT